MMSPSECAESIRAKQRQIDQLQQSIRDIAKDHIEDFHFLDYQVSTFWTCDKSPIGMCVFELDYKPFAKPTHCRYCGGPVERK